jgi:cell division protein FtsN
MSPAPKTGADASAAKADRQGADAQHWTLQLISTPDSSEAQRMLARVRSAGFPATVVQEKGLFKVRLTQTGTRDAVDATANRLKNRGFKPFPMKAGQP